MAIEDKLGLIHEKINAVAADVTYLRGRFDAELPHLATKAELKNEIAAHKNGCNKRISLSPKKKNNGKITLALLSAIGCLTAVIYALIRLFV